VTSFNVSGKYSPFGDGYPSGRYGHSISILSNSSLIIFGGQGYGNDQDSSTYGYGYLNDLWRYEPIDNTWYFLVGNMSINELNNLDNISGYGLPSGRYLSSFILLSNGSKILFGGRGSLYTKGDNTYLNDMWLLNICECIFGLCSICESNCSQCFYGYFGSNCNSSCSCLYGGCDMNGNCNSSCSCLYGSCDMNGNCSCNDGFHGINCDQRCIDVNCSYSCICNNTDICYNSTSIICENDISISSYVKFIFESLFILGDLYIEALDLHEGLA